MMMSHSFPLYNNMNVTMRQATSSIEQEESMMNEETRQLIEMEESECSSSSDEEEGIITESNNSSDGMPSLLSFPNHHHSLRLETIYEQQDMAVSSDGGSLSSAALTCVLAYGLVVALVMGFVATVLATAPGHLTSYMRNKKNN